MFEAVAKYSMVKNPVQSGRLLTEFIYNHDWIVDRVWKSCSRDLVRPCATKFATNYDALKIPTKEGDGRHDFLLNFGWIEHQWKSYCHGKTWRAKPMHTESEGKDAEKQPLQDMDTCSWKKSNSNICTKIFQLGMKDYLRDMAQIGEWFFL